MSGRKALTAALRAGTRRLALREQQPRSFSSNFANGAGARSRMSLKEMAPTAAVMLVVKRAMSGSSGKNGANGANSGDETGSKVFGNSSFGEAHPVELPMDDFELRVLGMAPKKGDGEDDDLLRELEEIERSASWRAAGPADGESGGEESDMQGEDDDDDDDDDEWEDERGQVLSDAALSAIVDYDLDDEQRPYQFRPDRLFFPGQTYDPEDLDLSKKPDELERPPPRFRRRYDNNEVLQRADFRNPRYLSNFIAETSRILPKRRSSLTAKAQRKVIREIKTARTFGLMPFTSMGRSPFRFLRSRLDEEDTSSGLNH